MSKQQQQVPEELVVEILARASVKDLIRSKCVCRAWNDLINDRSFVEKYRNTSRGRFVAFDEKGFCLIDVEDTNTGTEQQKLDWPSESMTDESLCVLHCHGMLCVTLRDHALAVWHPYSKEFKIIPNPGLYRNSSILGFGYDRFSDDYKIVTILDQLDSSTVYMFEFKSNSWIESLRIPNPDWHYRDRKGTYLDQNLYWIAYRSNQDRFILWFSLTTHEYQKLPFPVYNQCAESSWLGIMGQNLCVTEYEPLNQVISISVMEKTGAEPGSWNKVIKISTSYLISAPENHDYSVDFVSLTKNNDVLVTMTDYYMENNDYSKGSKRAKTKVLLYKTRDNTFKQVRFRNPLTELRFLETYVESPVINRIFI